MLEGLIVGWLYVEYLGFDRLESFGLVVVERPGSLSCRVSVSVSLLGVIVEYRSISLPLVFLGEGLRFPLGVWLDVLV